MAARGALAKVEASIVEYEEERRRAERRVENAIAEIMATAIDGVIRQVEALQHELDGRRAILTYLQPSCPPGERVRLSLALPSSPPGVSPPDYRNHAALTPWLAAWSALTHDADAALPR